MRLLNSPSILIRLEGAALLIGSVIAYIQLQASGDVKEKHRLYSPIDNLGLAERQRGSPKSVFK